jgi:hypothetical protein
MPIQNSGTLLENIVLVECSRTLLDKVGGNSVEVVNSFAMPPLSDWIQHPNNHAFNQNRLQRLAESLQDTAGGDDYPHLLARCVRTYPHQGPSGALLLALLLKMRRCQGRFWLNDRDDESRHYPETGKGLQNFIEAIDRIVKEDVPALEVAVCLTPYDDSLADLTKILKHWSTLKEPAVARIGFLDPKRYRKDGERKGAETSSRDHRTWVRLVRSYDPQIALAVHYTGHCNFPLLRAELCMLREDATLEGYQQSAMFSHDYFTTTVSVWHRTGSSQAEVFVQELTESVQRGWNDWCELTGRGRPPLGINEM